MNETIKEMLHFISILRTGYKNEKKSVKHELNDKLFKIPIRF